MVGYPYTGIPFFGVKTAGTGLIKYGTAAVSIPFGMFVTRSASTTLTQCTQAYPSNYLGVAIDDQKEHAMDGFYAIYDHVPFAVNGVVNVWLLGGHTVHSGDYVRLVVSGSNIGASTAALCGAVEDESTPTTRTLNSVGRFVGSADAGATAYSKTFSVTGAGVSTVTVPGGSGTDLTAMALKEGDYLALCSGEGLDIVRVVNPAASATTFTITAPVSVAHSTTPTARKLTQIEVLLL